MPEHDPVPPWRFNWTPGTNGKRPVPVDTPVQAGQERIGRVYVTRCVDDIAIEPVVIEPRSRVVKDQVPDPRPSSGTWVDILIAAIELAFWGWSLFNRRGRNK